MTTPRPTTYFKAVRPDGGSFHDPDFRWLPEGWESGDPIPEGWTVEHPDYSPTGGAAYYLSVSTVATDCTGTDWPCVLLEVKPVGEVTTPEPDRLPNKRAGAAFRVVRELPATDALGPQGVHVAALIERSRRLTADDVQKLTAARGDTWDARDAAWEAATEAARDAAGGAAWDAAEGAAWGAPWVVRDAALALVVRDVLAREEYGTLTRPWRTTIGPIHPDDNDMED